MKIYNITASCFECHKSEKTEENMIKIKMFENHLVRHIEYVQLESENKFVKQKAQEFIKSLLIDPDDWLRLSEKNKTVKAVWFALVHLPHHFKEICQIEIDDSGDFTRLLHVEYKQRVKPN